MAGAIGAGFFEVRSAGTSPVLIELRALLDRRLTKETSLADAARALATSERTLQRRLAASSTMLSDEIALAKVRAAMRRMLETEECAHHHRARSGLRFATTLRAAVRRFEGASPSSWRSDNKR